MITELLIFISLLILGILFVLHFFYAIIIVLIVLGLAGKICNKIVNLIK